MTEIPKLSRSEYQNLTAEEKHQRRLAQGRLYAKQARERDPQRVRALNNAANRRYYERDIEEKRKRRAKHVRDWRARHPDWREPYGLQIKASRAVTNATRDGRLQRGPCEMCGADHVEGHHDDYTKPLDVRWLCPTHHREVHACLPREL